MRKSAGIIGLSTLATHKTPIPLLAVGMGYYPTHIPNNYYFYKFYENKGSKGSKGRAPLVSLPETISTLPRLQAPTRVVRVVKLSKPVSFPELPEPDIT